MMEFVRFLSETALMVHAWRQIPMSASAFLIRAMVIFET